MSKQLSEAPQRVEAELEPESKLTTTTARLRALKKRQPSVFWPWLGGLLVVGLVIIGVVSLAVSNWLSSIQNASNTSQPSSPATTVKVQRSLMYAELQFTLLNMKYATSFNDDLIHSGQAVVRAEVSVKNPTQSTISLMYYDIVRLLVPKQNPLAPSNLNLGATLNAGATQTGWIDFPVASNTTLNTLKFQLGNAKTNEQLATLPVSGSYNANQGKNHLYHVSLGVNYYFKGWQLPGYWLHYHVSGVDVRSAYNGVQAKVGQQFYVLTFTVDNPNATTVAPGRGYDYLRLGLSTNHAPVDSTLPSSFKSNAHGISGRVVFTAPAGLHTLNVVFLRQAVAGWDTYPVSL